MVLGVSNALHRKSAPALAVMMRMTMMVVTDIRMTLRKNVFVATTLRTLNTVI